MKLNIQLFAEGKVVIKTEMDNKQLEKDIIKSKKELEKLEKEESKLFEQRKKIDIDTADAKKQIDELTAKIEELNQFKQERAKLSYGKESASYVIAEERIKQAEEERSNLLDEVNSKYDEIDAKIKQNQKSQQQVRDEIEKTANSLNKINLAPTLEKMSKGLSSVVSKVGKWAIALIGIRTAYSLIRQSANAIASENEQLAGKLEAVKNSLINLIKPVAEAIVNIVYKLLAYLNVITKTFLGIDLFAKTAKSAKNAVGSANKLKKTLAGFDEMNVLNDSSSSGGGGGGSADFNIKEPDVSKFQAIVDKFKTMWQEILNTDREEQAQMILQSDKTWGILKLGWFDYMQGSIRMTQGIINTIGALWDILIGWATDDDERLKKGQEALVEAIKLILKGLLQYMIAQVELYVGLFYGIGKSIVDFVYSKIIKPIINYFSPMFETIKSIFEPFIDFFYSLFSTTFENIKIMIHNTIEICKFLWKEIKKIFEPIVEFFRDKFNKAKEAIKKVFEPIVTFFNQIWTKIKSKFSEIGTKIGDAVGGAFKTAINSVLKATEKILNTPIKTINKLIDKINDIPGIKLTKLQTFSLPRLAKGGIINMPSRGVPVGGAIAGERGREGVIPLTDSQQMALLGEAIGRYITINANITNTMNGRVISRELQKINNENNFASNM